MQVSGWLPGPIARVEDFDDSQGPQDSIAAVQVLGWLPGPIAGVEDFDDFLGAVPFGAPPVGHAGRGVGKYGESVFRSVGAQRFHLRTLRKVSPSERLCPGAPWGGRGK